jgi:hypothetical protein
VRAIHVHGVNFIIAVPVGGKNHLGGAAVEAGAAIIGWIEGQTLRVAAIPHGDENFVVVVEIPLECNLRPAIYSWQGCRLARLCAGSAELGLYQWRLVIGMQQAFHGHDIFFRRWGRGGGRCSAMCQSAAFGARQQCEHKRHHQEEPLGLAHRFDLSYGFMMVLKGEGT